jgi:hypothetical protein
MNLSTYSLIIIVSSNIQVTNLVIHFINTRNIRQYCKLPETSDLVSINDEQFNSVDFTLK